MPLRHGLRFSSTQLPVRPWFLTKIHAVESAKNPRFLAGQPELIPLA